MAFWFVKDHICFVIIKNFKKKRFLITEKSYMFFLYVKKNEKDFPFKKRVSLII